MKKNKGFGIGILIAIVAILAVGGVAYYTNKSPKIEPVNLEKENLPQENQNDVVNVPVENNQVDNTANNNTTTTTTVTTSTTTSCLPTTSPWIKVLSPNGGETYTSGQQITVTWSKCNTTVNDQVMIILKSTQTAFGAEIATVPNTGTAIITLPTTFGGGQVPVTSGHYYKIRLELGGNATGHIAPSDESDNLFTISAKSVTPTPTDTTFVMPTNVSNITSTSAIFSSTFPQGLMFSQNLAGPYMYFEYSVTPSFGSTTPEVTLLANSTSHSAVVTNLLPNTTYYFRFVVKVTNRMGPGFTYNYSDTLSFVTLPLNSVSLGQQFTLHQNESVSIGNTGLEIKITKFYNEPCTGQCIWSGVGIEFEYLLNGQVKHGINLVQAFGYKTTIVETDNGSYAKLIVNVI